MRTVMVLAIGLGLAAACGVDQGWEEPAPCTGAKCSPGPTTETTRSMLKSVVKRVILPRGGKEFAVDLSGDGIPDNQLGRLIEMVTALFSVDLQSAFDEQLQNGKALLIYEVLGHSLIDSSVVKLRSYVGEDLDQNPADNFSGQEEFGVVSSKGAAVQAGAIHAGQLKTTEPALGILPLPFATQNTWLSPSRLTVRASVSPSGMTQGLVAGALSVEEISSKLVPVLAAELTKQYGRPDQSPAVVQAMKSGLDLDGDGTISADELKKSNALGLLLGTADMDTDGDGTRDSVSFGLAFQTVPCRIKAGASPQSPSTLPLAWVSPRVE